MSTEPQTDTQAPDATVEALRAIREICKPMSMTMQGPVWFDGGTPAGGGSRERIWRICDEALAAHEVAEPAGLDATAGEVTAGGLRGALAKAVPYMPLPWYDDEGPDWTDTIDYLEAALIFMGSPGAGSTGDPTTLSQGAAHEVAEPAGREDFVAIAQRIRSEHEAAHGEAEMCGAECIVLGLADFDDDSAPDEEQAAPEPLREAQLAEYVAVGDDIRAARAAAQGPEQAHPEVVDGHAPRLSVDGVCCAVHQAMLCACGNFGEHVPNVDCSGPEQARDSGGLRDRLLVAMGDVNAPDFGCAGPLPDLADYLAAALSQGAAHEERGLDRAISIVEHLEQPGRWAFLDTETGDWIELRPGVVVSRAAVIEALRLATPAPSTEEPTND